MSWLFGSKKEVNDPKKDAAISALLPPPLTMPVLNATGPPPVTSLQRGSSFNNRNSHSLGRYTLSPEHYKAPAINAPPPIAANIFVPSAPKVEVKVSEGEVFAENEAESKSESEHLIKKRYTEDYSCMITTPPEMPTPAEIDLPCAHVEGTITGESVSLEHRAISPILPVPVAENFDEVKGIYRVSSSNSIPLPVSTIAPPPMVESPIGSGRSLSILNMSCDSNYNAEADPLPDASSVRPQNSADITPSFTPVPSTADDEKPANAMPYVRPLSIPTRDHEPNQPSASLHNECRSSSANSHTEVLRQNPPADQSLSHHRLHAENVTEIPKQGPPLQSNVGVPPRSSPRSSPRQNILNLKSNSSQPSTLQRLRSSSHSSMPPAVRMDKSVRAGKEKKSGGVLVYTLSWINTLLTWGIYATIFAITILFVLLYGHRVPIFNNVVYSAIQHGTSVNYGVGSGDVWTSASQLSMGMGEL